MPDAAPARPATPTAPRLGVTPRQGVRIPVPFTGAYASLAAVCLVLAWEWLVSGFDKLASTGFVGSFGSYVSAHLRPGLPGFYDAFLRSVVVGHPRVFAVGSIVTELTLGFSLLIAAAVLLLRLPGLVRATLTGVLAAGAGGVIFAVNLAVLNGDPLPWQLGGGAFQSGVPVEYLLAMISFAAAVGAAILLRRTRYLAVPHRR